MNISYIGHACLLIECGDLRIITDPWTEGPAYCGQWHIFPKPVDPDIIRQADILLLSHGHEDHLHEPTLRRLPKDMRVFYPYSWYGGIKEYMHSIGFTNIREAITGRTYHLDDETSVTYIANNLDSIIVVEHKGEVVVNVNDALHAHHPNVIDAFIGTIKTRWPQIDTLFCGFGGASYFPNAIHSPGKDDIAIARAREQLFMHNFCRVAQGLAPDVAVPFAADFVLLAPWQRWINTVRFSRSDIADYYRTYFDDTGATIIQEMYPGDRLHGDRLLPSSPYRASLIDGSLDHLIDEQYGEEIARNTTTFFIPENSAEKLRRNIYDNVEHRMALFDEDMLAGMNFCVQVTDVERNNCYIITFDGCEPHVRRSAEPDPESRLVIRTTRDILEYSFASEWGGDAITIGYGAEIFVRDEKTVDEGLDTICVRLLTRHPNTIRHMKRQPLRAAKFLMTNPMTRSWAVRQIRDPKKNPQDAGGRKEWLTRTKCEVCRICDLPLLDAGFSAAIG